MVCMFYLRKVKRENGKALEGGPEALGSLCLSLSRHPGRHRSGSARALFSRTPRGQPAFRSCSDAQASSPRGHDGGLGDSGAGTRTGSSAAVRCRVLGRRSAQPHIIPGQMPGSTGPEFLVGKLLWPWGHEYPLVGRRWGEGLSRRDLWVPTLQDASSPPVPAPPQETAISRGCPKPRGPAGVGLARPRCPRQVLAFQSPHSPPALSLQRQRTEAWAETDRQPAASGRA